MADQVILRNVTKRFATKTLGDIVAVAHHFLLTLCFLLFLHT